MRFETRSFNAVQTTRWIFHQLEEWYECIGHWTLIFLIFVSPVIIALGVFLTPNVRLVVLIYTLWLYYDRKTPHVGGRRFKFMRNLKFWRYRREYFPIKLVKSAPLPANRTYLFATFPHGLIVIGPSTNFLSETNHFSQLFPGLVPYMVTLNTNFWWPLTRDLMLAFGICAASSRSILHILKGAPGNVCVVLVGGVAEALKSLPGQYTIVLRNRKGFVRTALQAGSSLVPVFSFGEPKTYDQVHGEWYIRLQTMIRSFTGIPFVIFKGRTILAGLPIGGLFSVLPHRQPITTVVGHPIELPKVENPSDELVNRYHQQFIRELQALFDRHKHEYDEKDATLMIE